MGELREMPTTEHKESEPASHQKIYLEFENMQKRAEAMQVINSLRSSHPDIFEGLQSIKVDEQRPEQGLEFAFSSANPDRAAQIMALLHERGITLNKPDGSNEEQPYQTAA